MLYKMNTQDGTNTSIYGMCVTAFMFILAHVTLSDVLTFFAILAAISTLAINVKNFIKKDKK